MCLLMGLWWALQVGGVEARPYDLHTGKTPRVPRKLSPTRPKNSNSGG